MKIKKGDQVLIISGKDKGRKGKVIDVLKDENRIAVDAINMRKKHVKAKKSGDKGQVISKPAPLAISNAQLVCPKCGQPSRIGYKTEAGKKFRVCKKCSSEI
ncbi:MAG: 50S ribosomal protein L24 [Patescibacteria group bacterium]